MKRSRCVSNVEQHVVTRPLATALFVSASVLAGCGRALFETIFIYRAEGAGLTVSHLVDFCAFYLAIGLSMALVLHLAGEIDWCLSLTVCSGGFGLALLPPILDAARYGVGKFRYLYGSEVSAHDWFTVNPMSMPIGEVVALVLVAVGSSVVVLLLKRSVPHSLLTLIFGFAAVFWHIYLLPTCGTWLERATMPIGVGGGVTLIQVIWVMLLRPLTHGARVRYLAQRLPHILPWGLTVCACASLSGHNPFMVVPIALIASLVFIGLIVENDMSDTEEDSLSIWQRPVDLLDVYLCRLGITFALVVACNALTVAGLALSVFYITGILYSRPPIRLKAKRFPSIYLTEGLWGTMVSLAGLELSAQGAWHDLIVAILVGLGFSVVSMIKDRKDISGDTHVGTQTIFTVLQNCGWSTKATSRIVGFAATTTLMIGFALVASYYQAHQGWMIAAILSSCGVGLSLACMEDGNAATRWSLIATCAYLGCVAFGVSSVS